MAERKIPTILALFILFAGLMAGVLGVQTVKGWRSRAVSSTSPHEVKVSNLSAAGFTVSYFTDEPVKGELIVDGKRYSDLGRDQVHYYLATGLTAGRRYSFQLLSGSEQLSMTVALPSNNREATSLVPVSGILDPPAEGAIVYVEGQDGRIFSTLSKKNGAYLILTEGAVDQSKITVVTGQSVFRKNSGFRRSFAKKKFLSPLADRAAVAASPFGDESSLLPQVAGTASAAWVVLTPTPNPTMPAAPAGLTLTLTPTPTPTPTRTPTRVSSPPVTGMGENLALLTIFGLGFFCFGLAGLTKTLPSPHDDKTSFGSN